MVCAWSAVSGILAGENVNFAELSLLEWGPFRVQHGLCRSRAVLVMSCVGYVHSMSTARFLCVCVCKRGRGQLLAGVAHDA